MQIDEFVGRLSGVKRKGDRFLALCPAHEDHKPSLSVSSGDDRRILVKCLAGCQTDAVLRSMGLEMADLFGAAPTPKHIASKYDYMDAGGELQYQIVRYEPKDFRARKPDGEGGWVGKLGNTKPILYRLMELQDADGPIVVVEGEKHVDVLGVLAISATTNPFGAGKWRQEYSQALRDRDVILWPDNDTAGRGHMEQVGRSLEGVAKSIRIVEPPEELGEKGDVWDGINILGWHRDDIDRILVGAKPWQPTESGRTDGADRDRAHEAKEPKESQASCLAKIVLTYAKLFHDQHHTAYAQVRIENHLEVMRCRSSGFRNWMAYMLYTAEGKAPGTETINAALNIVEAVALYDGDQIELFNRVAIHDGDFWLDLSDKRCRAVRVTAEGWEIVDSPPILFARHSHQAPQVDPKSGGNLDLIFDFIPIKDPDTRLLLKIWIVSCLVPDIPHPIPVLHGPQGSGKTSTARLLRRLVDPSSLAALSLPRNQAELAQILSHHYLVPFDNIDTLQAWQSDALCRGCTGEGISKRQLYTDDEDVIYSFRRCIVVNGINISATRADLLDRSILIGLERIPNNERRDEEGLESAFTQARPQILGGMLDALVKAIELKPSVELTDKPRMADFARWGCAISEALGGSSEDFVHAYQGNIEEQNAEVLDGHPVAAAVIALMDKQDPWEGRPTDLLQGLLELANAEGIDANARSWPKAANALTRRLNEVKTNLQDAGIHITHRKSGPRTITIRKEPENTVQTVQTVHDQNKQQDTDGRFTDDTDDMDDATVPRENADHDTVQPQLFDLQEDKRQLDGLDDTDGKFQKPVPDELQRIEIE